MEQALGHITHAKNLFAAAVARAGITPTWLPIPFELSGPARLVPVLRSNWSVRASWRARRALDRVLAQGRTDALLFHTQVTALFSVQHMRRLPAIVSLDATPINYDSVGAAYGHRPAGDGWLDQQKYRMNRAVLHTAAGLVTWSDWARRSVLEDYGVEAERVRVIAPGAARAYFELGEHRYAAQTVNPAVDAGRPIRLLFVGGDFERKGGPLLLDCLSGELAERCELHLVTGAAIPPRSNVHVHRGLGPNSPELLRLFAEADVFVLPSMGECLAVVLMEATAAGLPVITTDVAALSEAVVPGESGLLVPAADGRALRAAIDTLTRDSALRHRMGRSGLALAARKFDAERNNQALLDLIQATVDADRQAKRAA